MAEWLHTVIMIIPAELLESANAIARALDPDTGGDRTFSVPLSADGSEPATHYAASTAAAESFVQTVLAVTAGQAELAALVAGDYAARWPGLAPPAAEACTAFLAAAVIVVDRSWGEVLEMAGLMMLSPIAEVEA